MDFNLATILRKGLMPKLSGSASDVLLGTGVFGAASGVSVGGFTSGSVIFAHSDGTLTQDNANLFFDNTNNRLGLGTATPNEQLELTGNLRLSSTSRLKFGTADYLWSPSSGSVVLATLGSPSGVQNTLIGVGSGASVSTSPGNVIIGSDAANALTTGIVGQNVVIGKAAGAILSTGSRNVVIGAGADIGGVGTGSNRIAIGTDVTCDADNQATIGESITQLRTETDAVCTLGSSTKGWKGIYFDHTTTAVGTTGNRTINKPAGRVNIAAAGAAVTVTNSLVTADSLVLAWCMTNDTTAFVANVVPAASGFTVNLGAAATAEVAIGFLVINTD